MGVTKTITTKPNVKTEEHHDEHYKDAMIIQDGGPVLNHGETGKKYCPHQRHQLDAAYFRSKHLLKALSSAHRL